MKVGDKVRITWVDGFVAEGTYVRTERGFAVFLDADKKQFVSHPSHVKSMEVINESQ